MNKGLRGHVEGSLYDYILEKHKAKALKTLRGVEVT